MQGYKLAAGFILHYAGIAAKPAHPKHTAGVKFTVTFKVVFTGTTEQSSWDNTVFVRGNLADEIATRKAQPS